MRLNSKVVGIIVLVVMFGGILLTITWAGGRLKAAEGERAITTGAK